MTSFFCVLHGDYERLKPILTTFLTEMIKPYFFLYKRNVFKKTSILILDCFFIDSLNKLSWPLHLYAFLCHNPISYCL